MKRARTCVRRCDETEGHVGPCREYLNEIVSNDRRAAIVSVTRRLDTGAVEITTADAGGVAAVELPEWAVEAVAVAMTKRPKR